MLLALMCGSTAFAGESGYLQDGVAHAVYKNGKKVGEWPQKARTPSSMPNVDPDTNSVTVFYQDDDVTKARCYAVHYVNAGSAPDAVTLSCIKK